AVVPGADQRGEHLVAPGERPEAGEGLGLGDRLVELERLVVPDRRRHRLVEQVVEARGPDDLEHAGDVVGRRPDVAVGEVLGAGAHGAAPVSRWGRWSGAPVAVWCRGAAAPAAPAAPAVPPLAPGGLQSCLAPMVPGA